MPYCKYCKEHIDSTSVTHHCSQMGSLNAEDDDSFLVSAIIGAATDSALLGGLLGGDMAGGIIGDLLDGDFFD